MSSRRHLIIDLFIIAATVVVAIFLVKSGVIERLIGATGDLKYMGAFIAGIFFTSAFTSAIATVTFVELAQFNSVFLLAILGGLGALIGDLAIFRFVGNRFNADVQYLLSLSGRQRLYFIFHRRLFRWVAATLGALVIASPLPDEIGIALLGLAKIKIKKFMLVSFVLNTIGILIIVLIAKTL